MSSWSGSAYPPPRGRSRSRSPYRAGYPPARPEPGYPSSDPHRGEWDAYERERAWAQYERERAGYDYGRRGRSRSPPPDEGILLPLVYAPTCLCFVVFQLVESDVGRSHRGSGKGSIQGHVMAMTMVMSRSIYCCVV